MKITKVEPILLSYEYKPEEQWGWSGGEVKVWHTSLVRVWTDEGIYGLHRICNNLRIVETKTPLETEMRLREVLPVKYWKTWNSHLVSFGQTRCDPVRPKCDGCPIKKFCRSPKKK